VRAARSEGEQIGKDSESIGENAAAGDQKRGGTTGVKTADSSPLRTATKLATKDQ
jgi:hypothetical protein